MSLIYIIYHMLVLLEYHERKVNNVKVKAISVINSTIVHPQIMKPQYNSLFLFEKVLQASSFR